MYRVYFLNYILNESQADMKHTNSVTSFYDAINYFSSEYK